LPALQSPPNLSGPHEYFDREAYRYHGMLKARAAGPDAEVRAGFRG
jgi:hypothetical protein